MTLLARLLAGETKPAEPPRPAADGPLEYISDWTCEHGILWSTWARGERAEVDPICGCWLDVEQPGLLPDHVRIDGIVHGGSLHGPGSPNSQGD